MKTFRMSLVLVAFAMIVPACGGVGVQPTPSPTALPPTPTATIEPLAARVNGDFITLASFEAELARYRAVHSVSGTDPATSSEDVLTVLNARIDRMLLAQGALEVGIMIDVNEVAAHIDQLAADLGGLEAVAAWLAAQGYSAEEFELALQEDMLARAMVDHLTQDIARIQEHVRARHILVTTSEEAQDIQARLAAGETFEELARNLSTDPSTRPAGGDLGWFPRNTLLIPEVETTAFELQTGAISDVIESSLGFHIIETIARESRVITEENLLRQQEWTVSEWLDQRRQNADITVYITPETW